MLKKTIKYKNFNGQDAEKTVYFYLSQTELTESVLDEEKSLVAVAQAISETEDRARGFALIKSFVLSAYGVKSDNGEDFVKSDELRTAFTHTAAFDALMIELTTNANACADFMNGCVPNDVRIAGMAVNEGTNASAVAIVDQAIAAQAKAPLLPPTIQSTPSV